MLRRQKLQWWLYLAPRYWPVWMGFAVLRVIAPLPYVWQCALGRAMGRAVYRLLPRRRKIAAVNLKWCFPELDESAHQGLLRRHFESIGISLIDMAVCWWASDRRVQALYQVKGIEHLRDALACGQGVLLCCGHFTSLELVGRMLAMAIPELQFVYRKHNNPLIDAFQTVAHLRYISKVIPNSNTRGMLRSLRTGHALYYLPDQNYHGKLSTFVSFFGHQASTTTATSQFVKRTGAAVVPMMPLRLPNHAGYLLDFSPMLTEFSGTDDVRDAQALMTILEAQIRLAPEQYLWAHRRFKSRPMGESSPY